MQSLKNLRVHLGLSQIQFSGLLGISSGLIALVETGKRNLPENARKIVLNLQQLILTMEPFDSDSIQELDAASQKLLEKEIILFLLTLVIHLSYTCGAVVVQLSCKMHLSYSCHTDVM